MYRTFSWLKRDCDACLPRAQCLVLFTPSRWQTSSRVHSLVPLPIQIGMPTAAGSIHSSIGAPCSHHHRRAPLLRRKLADGSLGRRCVDAASRFWFQFAIQYDLATPKSWADAWLRLARTWKRWYVCFLPRRCLEWVGLPEARLLFCAVRPPPNVVYVTVDAEPYALPLLHGDVLRDQLARDIEVMRRLGRCAIW
jgi:hypothetical protein